jgi:hypothetical protein
MFNLFVFLVTKLAKLTKPFSHKESRQPAPFQRQGGCEPLPAFPLIFKKLCIVL